MNWPQLNKALADGIPTDGKSSLGRLKRFAADPHPCGNCVYVATLTFEQDADNQWRWTGVVYPGD